MASIIKPEPGPASATQRNSHMLSKRCTAATSWAVIRRILWSCVNVSKELCNALEKAPSISMFQLDY